MRAPRRRVLLALTPNGFSFCRKVEKIPALDDYVSACESPGQHMAHRRQSRKTDVAPSSYISQASLAHAEQSKGSPGSTEACEQARGWTTRYHTGSIASSFLRPALGLNSRYQFISPDFPQYSYTGTECAMNSQGTKLFAPSTLGNSSICPMPSELEYFGAMYCLGSTVRSHTGSSGTCSTPRHSPGVGMRRMWHKHSHHPSTGQGQLLSEQLCSG